FCAMDLPQTLESKIENSTNKHETFEFSQDSCPHKESPESISPSATCSHQGHRHLLILPGKMYRRVVVDAFVYHKHNKCSLGQAYDLKQSTTGRQPNYQKKPFSKNIRACL